MIPPIRLLLQLRITFEEFDRQFAFYSAHILRYRNLWRDTNHQMDMIKLDIQFDHLTTLPLSQHPNIMIDQVLNDTD